MSLARSAVAVLAAALLAAPVAQQPAAVAWPRTITLTIVTATDQPVPGARVELWPSEQAAGAWRYTPTVNGRFLADVFEDPDPRPVPQPPAHTAQADESGRLRLELPSREAVFAARFGDGAASGLWYARAVEREEAVTVPLDPVGEIAGVVLTQAGEPVRGAAVRFQDVHLPDPWEDGASGRGEPRCPRDVLTGADGRFTAPAERRFLGLARARTPESWTETVHAASRGPSAPPLRLRVPGRFRILVTCVDEMGLPFPGARVSAERALLADRPAATADPFGRVELRLVDPGWYVVTARHQNQPEQTLERRERVELSEAAPEAEVTLRFVRAASIRGRVQWADGKPVAGVAVRTPMPLGGSSAGFMPRPVQVADATTAADGTFEIRGLLPGCSVDLEAQLRGDLEPLAGRGLLADRVLRDIPAGSTDVLFVFDDLARRGGRVMLRVRDAESGEPLDDAEALVTVYRSRTYPSEVPPEKPLPNVARGPGGALVLDGLRSSLRHALIVQAPGHEAAAVGPVDVLAEPVQLDVALRPLGTVVVRIEPPEQAPPNGSWLMLLDPQTAPLPKFGAQRRRMLSAAGNELRVQSAAGVALFLQAWNGSLTSDVASVVPSAQEERVVTLSIGPQAAGSLEVRVIDEAGQAVAGAEVSIVRTAGDDVSASAVSDKAGLARFPALPPGLWFATCADPDRGFGNEAVAVAAGEHATLVLPTR
jgi:hypothetical protein